MDIQATIEYRKVRSVRLEYGIEGLRIIVPISFTGNVEDLVVKHKTWIARRSKQMQALQEKTAELKLENRTDQLLRILVNRC
ncbi:MAG: hypothetical protein M3Q64_00470 [bacterium]|nr:hypothetical protein [bacterium]